MTFVDFFLNVRVKTGGTNASIYERLLTVTLNYDQFLIHLKTILGASLGCIYRNMYICSRNHTVSLVLGHHTNTRGLP